MTTALDDGTKNMTSWNSMNSIEKAKIRMQNKPMVAISDQILSWYAKVLPLLCCRQCRLFSFYVIFDSP